jgi:hypothetical protein
MSVFRLSTHDHHTASSEVRGIDRLSVDVAYTPKMLFVAHSDNLSVSQSVSQSVSHSTTERQTETDKEALTESEKVRRQATTELEKELPWFDVNGQWNEHIFQFYAIQVTTFLSEYPQCTLSHIHIKLAFLPLLHVEALMTEMVQEKIVKVIKRSNAWSTLQVNDPFQVKTKLTQLKERRSSMMMLSSNSSVRGSDSDDKIVCYYSLNTSCV